MWGKLVFGTPCDGPAHGDGHEVAIINRLGICMKCGSYSQGAALKAGLKRKCNEPTSTGISNKSRVSQGGLPLALRHLASWPDGTPLKADSTKRKAKAA